MLLDQEFPTTFPTSDLKSLILFFKKTLRKTAFPQIPPKTANLQTPAEEAVELEIMQQARMTLAKSPPGTTLDWRFARLKGSEITTERRTWGGIP